MLTKSKFSILYLFLAIILFYIGNGFSQNASYLDSLDGKFALQFQINDNFQLSSFQGTVFSGKYHFCSRDAIRLGLSIEFGDSESETEITRIDTTDFDRVKSDDSRYSATVNTQYIRYLGVTNNISFFGGIGPFVRIFNLTTESIINENGIDVKRESKRNGFSTGADVILGMEWWFYKYMSLSAEYGMKFSYMSSEDKLKDDTIEIESTSKSFYLGGNHVNFGITVYF
jgi:hypothetical protein